MKNAARKTEPDPLIIHRSADREGATYALDRRSRDRLRKELGDEAHFAPRVFIAHETEADYKQIRGAIMPQIALILTGLPERRLSELGAIVFIDPVTEEKLDSWRPARP